MKFLQKKTFIAVLSFCLTLCLHVVSSENSCNSDDGKACGKSETVSLPGHWPSSYCKVTNVMFHSGNQIIKLNGDVHDLDKCFKVQDIWKFESRTDYQELNSFACDQVFTRGHFFTMYYFHGSNYFHLHYDTLIPLYVALHQQQLKHTQNKEVTLLPSVEATRGEGIDWNTDAFMDYESYWMQMLMTVSKSHRVLPLDRRLTAINKTLCFKEAFFGTPRVNFSDSSLLHSYSNFMKKVLGVENVALDTKKKPKIGLIHRDGRRKILNEDQLIRSVESFATVELTDFSTLSVKEQIQKVQEYNVLIGMNGAGLINGLFLPKTSVAVQLVPYKAQLNVNEYANLLKARGPYLEWHNSHPELNHPAPDDPFKNASDTVVDVNEFVDMVSKALKLHKAQSES
uniref:U10-Liphistoxin-Lth1a_1 n=1 Tax=Liphistius thaleban TaxID=1905330 RepID=A0A4Q8K6M3_9ARAC